MKKIITAIFLLLIITYLHGSDYDYDRGEFINIWKFIISNLEVDKEYRPAENPAQFRKILVHSRGWMGGPYSSFLFKENGELEVGNYMSFEKIMNGYWKLNGNNLTIKLNKNSRFGIPDNLEETNEIAYYMFKRSINRGCEQNQVFIKLKGCFFKNEFADCIVDLEIGHDTKPGHIDVPCR